MTPKLTVIIPTYNRKQRLLGAIQSVLEQSFECLELIIVDDGSTDGTPELQQTLTDPRLVWLAHSGNKGVSAARNLGISKAEADWVAFLDSDDLWHPTKIEEQFNYLEQNSSCKVVHTDEAWLRNGEPLKQLAKHKKSGGRIFDKCLPLCCISPSTVMIHQDVFRTCGVFSEEFVVCEDYELWLRICSRFDIGFIEKPLITKHGGHDDQLSHKYKAMDYWRVKALAQFLDSTEITDTERSLLIETLIKKCTLLVRGYKKHNNTENLDEVSLILQRAENTSAKD